MRALVAVAFALGAVLAPGSSLAEESYEEAFARGTKIAQKLLDALSAPEADAVSYGDGYHVGAIDVAVKELLRERVVARYPDDRDARAVSASMLLDVYLLAGLDAQAIAFYESLDESERALVIAGPVVAGATDGETYFSVDVVPRTSAVGLAAAYADAGHSATAEQLLAQALRSSHASDSHNPFANARLSAEVADSCARTLLRAGTGTDWFEWSFRRCAWASPSRAYGRRAAAALAASSLPEPWRAAGVAPNAEPGLIDSDQEDLDAALAELPELQRRAETLRRELAALDERDARWIAKDDDGAYDSPFSSKPVAGSDADRALAARIGALIAREPWTPFRVVPVAAEEAQRAAQLCQTAEALRCAERDGVRWLLYGSSDYDPTGEVPAAGYWLKRIEHGKAERDYYLAINEHRPYELADPDVPIVVGDELRLRVRRAEIDPAQVTFPPIGLEIARSGDVVELRAALDDIVRDSDEDGLTDLAEGKLLLDPNAADSDSDGRDDATDPVPHVAFAEATNSRSQALAAGLSFIAGQEEGGISVLVPGSAEFERRRVTSERTRFLIVDPADVAGLVGDRRIVVLPLSLDFEVLRKRRGFELFYATRFTLRFLDESHAELEYGSGWGGGTLALELENGRWRVGVLTQWIT